MRILKIVLYGLAGLAALLLVVALLSPGSYRVEKSIEINSPIESVFLQVANYNHFRKWNPWSLSDPKAIYTVTGIPATAGHQYEWNGENVGIGKLTMTEVIPNKSVAAKLTFVEPHVSGADDNWTFETTASGGTKVVWVNSGNLSFPVERLFGLFLRGMLNKQFEEGLNNLKKISETGKL
ncbi:MAG: SRPBCC family protein [Sphingobacteriales bacterium]|nr:MAG: SRPBCC family protein [Sphingobacteriales bacterium]